MEEVQRSLPERARQWQTSIRTRPATRGLTSRCRHCTRSRNQDRQSSGHPALLTTTDSSNHTHGEYRETYQRGETDNVGIHAVRTKVLHTSSTAHGRYTHSRLRRDETLTREREREESALAQVLFNTFAVLLYCADAPPTLAADAAPRHRPEGGGGPLRGHAGLSTTSLVPLIWLGV